jgi:hypothetical protein
LWWGISDLEYPKALSAAEREEAGKKLAGLPADLAQQLDELAASIRAKVIQATPLAYLRSDHACPCRHLHTGGRFADRAHRQRRIEVNAGKAS